MLERCNNEVVRTIGAPRQYGDTKEFHEVVPAPSLSSRTLAEPDRCKRSVAKLAIRDPEQVGRIASNMSLGPGSNTRGQLLTQLSACNGRDDRVKNSESETLWSEVKWIGSK